MLNKLRNILKHFYYKMVPGYIRLELFYWRRINSINKVLRKEIMDNPNSSVELIPIIEFLKHNHKITYPYDFIKKYSWRNIDVYNDNDWKYVLYDNKRMYFPRSWRKKDIQYYYEGILCEQDKNSPHCYKSKNFDVQTGDSVADVGAAEGFFALSVIEKARNVYLFECENSWIEALQKTFSPWKEKIEIVNKYVSDNDNNNCVSLDNFFKDKKINFIKADIEGAEFALLDGAKNILTEQKLNLVLCAYHRDTDADNLQKILEKYNFRVEFSRGYMIVLMNGGKFLRKGVIRAVKGG